jgi:RimJ/RimL family protein N-acetyltransferase
MEFRRLIKSDLNSYFANRLRALEHAPSAFLTTLAEEKSRGTAHFETTLAYDGDDKVIFGAVLNGAVVGTIGLFREDRAKTNHKSMIWGKYVDIEHRGKGIGGKLLDLAIDHAQTKMNSVALYLSVESLNTTARKLYESRAFKCWGTEPKAMSFEGQYWDMDQMVLELDQKALRG